MLFLVGRIGLADLGRGSCRFVECPAAPAINFWGGIVACSGPHPGRMNDKKNLEETDPNVRRQRQDELRNVANNVQKSRELLLQTSMINGLERSEAIV